MMMRLTDKSTKHPDTARILVIHADFLSIKTVKTDVKFLQRLKFVESPLFYFLNSNKICKFATKTHIHPI